MKNIKRIFILMLLILVSINFFQKVEAQNDFALTIHSREIKNVMGIQHQKLTVTMRFNGVLTNQRINYIGANVTTNKNVSLVALDNYSDDLIRGTLLEQIEHSQKRYPNQKIVAAVNGDYFDINSQIGQAGATAGPHIRDGKVIFQGYSYGAANLAGIKNDGTPFIEKPTYGGYHVQVYDEEGSLKLKDLPVKINEAPSEGKLNVFLPSYKHAETLNGRKMIIKADETIIHKGPGDVELGRYFVNGKLQEITSEQIDEIEEGTMVLMGDDFFLEDLINPTDDVRLQNKLTGAAADAYQAISGTVYLVKNGVVQKQTNTELSVRTAVGIKADGSIFFLVVDGRFPPEFVGVTYEQLGEIFKYFGAETAVRFDGGGSATIAVYDEKEDDYVIHNRPSDGNLRRNGNGIGFVVGENKLPPGPIPYPDTREVLESVSSILIEGNKLSFTPVKNALKYVINIGGYVFETTETELILNVDPGLHEISINAYGDNVLYKQSGYTEFKFETYSQSINNVMDVLYSYGRKTHQYFND